MPQLLVVKRASFFDVSRLDKSASDQGPLVWPRPRVAHFQYLCISVFYVADRISYARKISANILAA